jgi:hypothetical protein
MPVKRLILWLICLGALSILVVLSRVAYIAQREARMEHQFEREFYQQAAEMERQITELQMDVQGLASSDAAFQEGWQEGRALREKLQAEGHCAQEGCR